MSEVDDVFLAVMEDSPTTDDFKELNNYMVYQWIDNPVIGCMWNCYKERHRTTNYVEAWHSRLNKAVKKSHQNQSIAKFILQICVEPKRIKREKI